jgi:glycosyltransferase involved in cell wall biosynthesis
MRIFEVALSGTLGTRRMGPVSSDICELSNRFAMRGHEVVVFDVPAEEPRDLLHPDIRLIEVAGVPQSRVARSRHRAAALVRRWRNYDRCMRGLMSQLDPAQADIMHFHAPEPAFIAQRAYGVAAVAYTAHTPTWSLVAPAPRSVIGRMTMWMEKSVMRRSFVSVGFGDYLAAAVPGANVVTIPNGIDFDAWPTLARAGARRALGIADDRFIVLFTGRIHPVKGIDTLLEAVGLVAASMPNLQTYAIGPLSGSFDTRDEYIGAYARRMSACAKELPVRFLGFISNRELRFRQYLAAADVFVLPSRSEPQGLVVLEALAMGTPVIGSATGGIPDMVTDEVGYLFPPGNAGALAACIRTAHDDPAGLRVRQAAAREHVLRSYSWDTVADRYLAAFERCAESVSRMTGRAWQE